MADIHKDRIVTGNVSLLSSGAYSDITIRCGSNEYKLHRAILCPSSTFFATICKGDFIEAKTAVITMNDDDPQTVKRMLFYLYTLDYPDSDVPNVPAEYIAMERSLPAHLQLKTSATSEDAANLNSDPIPSKGTDTHDPRMMNNVSVYATAEKYDIPELKELAKSKFENVAWSKWPCEYFDAVAEAVFSTTPDSDMGLRQIVVDICEAHFRDILSDGKYRAGFLGNQAIAAVVADAAIRKFDMDGVRFDEALAKQIAMKEELAKAKADTQEAVDQKNKWMSQLEYLLKQGNNVQKCVICCKSRFDWSVDCSGTSSKLAMRLTCHHCGMNQLLPI